MSTDSTTPPTADATNSGRPKLMEYIMQDKVSAVLWVTRVFTIVFSLLFVFPFTGFEQSALYQKALMLSAVTSALKLQQRMTGVPFQMNRIYLSKLIIEDSFHYLLFALIFLNSYPITIVLMPISAFALLHAASYAKTLLDLIGGPDSFGLIRRGVLMVLAKDKHIMRFIAVNEIILGPTIIIMIFSGKTGIMVPFIYYRFISMRYQSRRNPYSRLMFTELRVALEHYSTQPSCPLILRNLVQRLIGVVIRFAPEPLA